MYPSDVPKNLELENFAFSGKLPRQPPPKTHVYDMNTANHMVHTQDWCVVDNLYRAYGHLKCFELTMACGTKGGLGTSWCTQDRVVDNGGFEGPLNFPMLGASHSSQQENNLFMNVVPVIHVRSWRISVEAAHANKLVFFRSTQLIQRTKFGISQKEFRRQYAPLEKKVHLPNLMI